MITVQKAAVNTALVAALVGGGAYLAMGYPVLASSTTGSQSSTDSAHGQPPGQRDYGAAADGEHRHPGAERGRSQPTPARPSSRVENDAEGAVYEAHITKADGSRATVKLDGSFNITATEAGYGR